MKKEMLHFIILRFLLKFPVDEPHCINLNATPNIIIKYVNELSFTGAAEHE